MHIKCRGGGINLKCYRHTLITTQYNFIRVFWLYRYLPLNNIIYEGPIRRQAIASHHLSGVNTVDVFTSFQFTTVSTEEKETKAATCNYTCRNGDY